jgi:hypothetical protein
LVYDCRQSEQGCRWQSNVDFLDCRVCDPVHLLLISITSILFTPSTHTHKHTLIASMHTLINHCLVYDLYFYGFGFCGWRENWRRLKIAVSLHFFKSLFFTSSFLPQHFYFSSTLDRLRRRRTNERTVTLPFSRHVHLLLTITNFLPFASLLFLLTLDRIRR